MFIKRSLNFLFALSVALGMVGSVPSVEALTVSPVKLELRGDPGTTIGSDFMLINEQDEIQTFYVSFANFEAQGESGTPQFVESGKDLATWINLVPSGENTEEVLNMVSLAPGASQKIYFEVNIPADASPGGHFAAIFWGTSPETTVDTTELGLGAKVGILVFLSVNGEVNEAGGLVDFGVENEQKFFTDLPVDFFYRFQNDGGDRVVPQGTVSIKNMLGLKTDIFSANLAESNVLPLSIRRFETSWGTAADVVDETFWGHVKNQWHQFAFGYYQAELDLTYGSDQEITFAETSFWVLPWQLLLVLGLSLFVFVLLGTFVIRNYNRWIIAQAVAAQRSVRRKPTKKKKP